MSDDDTMPRLQVRKYEGHNLLYKGKIHLHNESSILVTCAGAACSALEGLQQGVHLVGLHEPTCVLSLSNSPLVLAVASSDTLYQMTDNINSLIQQQLSGGFLDPARHGSYWATRTKFLIRREAILCIIALFRQAQSCSSRSSYRN